MSPEREEQLRALEEKIGHHFADLSLLDRALTHASRANERGVPNNEPFEFLGDAILGFIIADLLHRRDPDADEGTKSRTRAAVVSAPSLARRSANLGIPDLLALGRSEEKTGRKKTALCADAYEALIAAVYLDGGLEAAHRFVAGEFAADLVAGSEGRDYKSALQELLQARGDPVPDYVVVAEEGPSHHKRFRIQCVIRGEAVSEAEGSTKKQAQQEGARKALERLESEGR